MGGIEVAIESPDQAEVVALLQAGDAHAASLYRPDRIFTLDFDELQAPEVTLFIARRAGKAVGCAALVNVSDAYAEIKRMYVDKNARGSGAGKALLAALTHEAGRRGIPCLRVETGVHQPEAISLYRRDGFSERGPFGNYAADPVCVFMEKRL